MLPLLAASENAALKGDQAHQPDLIFPRSPGSIPRESARKSPRLNPDVLSKNTPFLPRKLMTSRRGYTPVVHRVVLRPRGPTSRP